MMANEQSVIVAGVRTPIGAFLGGLSAVPAPRLGAECVRALIERTGAPADRIDEVLMGTCIAAGQGMNPARQAALLGGLPNSVHAATINEACASGMRAVMIADQVLRANDARVIIAGGMESMSQAPYLLPKARQGYRLGDGQVIDSMMHDGLTDAYAGKPMGCFADVCAREFGIDRARQDAYAVLSHARARKALAEKAFAREIVPVSVTVRGKTTTVVEDEGPSKFDEAKLLGLRPAFSDDGTVTAGNASSLNDGAAALLVSTPSVCEELGLKPVARIVGAAIHSQAPDQFTTAPVGALRKLLDKVGWKVEDVDLFEVNEAFAVVALTVSDQTGLPAERTNVFGGAVALGHPIGSSGARLLVTLIHGLERTGGRRGVAALCVGGGEGIAMAVERIV
jgi:acetyl-CoA C-acetyltransferase